MLFWCNSSNALILSNCFTIESSDPEIPIYTKFHKDSWDADSWKIYFEQKIVTNVTVFSDKGYKKKKELIEYFNKKNVGRDGFPMEPPDRIITRTYTMTFGDESVVTTEDRKITSHGDLKKTIVLKKNFHPEGTA